MADEFRIKVQVAGAGVVTFDKRSLRALMRQAGNEVAGRARTMIRSNPAGGRVYAVRHRGALELHQASAPGQPPASISGTLASSIRVRTYRDGDGVSIRETAFYALFLEAGARGVGRRGRGGSLRRTPAGARVLAPRPSLSAALDELRPSIERRLQAAVLVGVMWKNTP